MPPVSASVPATTNRVRYINNILAVGLFGGVQGTRSCFDYKYHIGAAMLPLALSILCDRSCRLSTLIADREGLT